MTGFVLSNAEVLVLRELDPASGWQSTRRLIELSGLGRSATLHALSELRRRDLAVRRYNGAVTVWQSTSEGRQALLEAEAARRRRRP